MLIFVGNTVRVWRTRRTRLIEMLGLIYKLLTRRGSSIVNLQSQLVRQLVFWKSDGCMWSEGAANFSNTGFRPQPIHVGKTYSVRFKAPAKSLSHLSLQFGTYRRRNAGDLLCSLRDFSGETVVTNTIKLSSLVDNELFEVLKLEGLQFYPEKFYHLHLSLNAEQGNEVALFTSKRRGRTSKISSRRKEYAAPEGVPAVARDNVEAALPPNDWLNELLREDRWHQESQLKQGDTVVVCTHALPPGGAERQWVYLAVALKQAGYKVRVILYDIPKGPEAHYLPLLQAAAVPMHFLSTYGETALPLMLAQDDNFAAMFQDRVVPDGDRLARMILALKEIRPRVVFAQLDDPNLYAGFASLLAGIPRVILSFRSYNPSHFPFIHQEWFARAYSALAKSDRVLFCGNSRDANADYERWLGLRPGRVTYIPNAISTAHFTAPTKAEIAACRRDLAVSEGQRVVLGVFRLSPEKNPKAFIDVCAQLASSVVNLRVLIAGTGPLFDAMNAQVAELGLDHIVTMLGRRSDMNVLMSLANVLLLTSDREGMPNVVLEAQLMGLPVVATQTGGTADAVRPGISAELCPPADIAALAKACEMILNQPDRAASMGEAGARYVREVFRIDTMADNYIRLAQTKIGGRTALSARKLLLANEHPDPDDESLFFNSIKTSDGIWKTTSTRRMDDLNCVFAEVYRGGNAPDILDVGASSGISTVEWRDDLISRGFCPNFVASDLTVEGFLVEVAPAHYVLTDQAGIVLQHDVDNKVMTPDEYEYFKGVKRRGASKYLGWVATSHHRLTRRERRVPVRLVSARARTIKFVQDDVFAPNGNSFQGGFDVLRAANLLNHCYFSPVQLELGVKNLRARLKGKGAMLVVNRTHADGSNHGSLFTLDDTMRFSVAGRVGNGSEVEDIVLSL